MRQRPAASQVVRRRPAREPEPEATSGPGTSPLVNSGTREGWARRQYAWWITFAHPYDDTVVRLQLRTPSSFTRQEFLDASLRCHLDAGVRLEEAAVFKELHSRVDADGERVPHLNIAVRSSDRFVWTEVAKNIGNSIGSV